MSDLQPVGVRLVADGAALFERAITRAAGSLNVLERASKIAGAGMKALDQIVTGALRRVGELAVDAFVRAAREVARFASRLVEAAAAGTPLESSLDKLYRSLVQVTRTSLEPLFTQLDGLITRAAPTVLGFAQMLGTHFGGIAANAVAWGENIIASVAQGMWNAVVYIIDALTAIGSMITGWLAPGSPPKLLPDLDDWGRDAANVWLEGWTKADFSIFETLSGTIESLIRSTGAPGGRDTGLIPRILGAREGIAQAVEELRTAGAVSAATLDAIVASVGSADQATRAYLEAAIGLQAANETVAEAQANLNRVTAEYDALLRPITDQLAAISEAEQQLTDDQRKGMLALVLADPNATAAEKRRAQLELERIDAEKARRALLAEKADAVEAAQGELAAAEAGLVAAQALYDAQAALMQLQIEQNNLLKEQASLWEKIAAAVSGGAPKPGGGGGGGKGIFGIDLSEATAFFDALMTKLGELRSVWETTWAAILDVLQPVVDAWNNDVRAAWDRLVAAITDSLPVMQAQLALFVAEITKQLGIQAPTILRNLGISIDTLAKIWEENHVLILGATRAAFTAAFTIILSTMTIISGIITTALVLIEGAWSATLKVLKGDWRGAWEDIKRVLSQAELIIKTTLGTAIAGYLSLFGMDVDSVMAGVSAAIDGVVGSINGLLGAVASLVGALASIPGLAGAAAAALGNGVATTAAGVSGGGSMAGGSSITNNYNYAPTYSGSPVSPATDFAVMSVMA